MNVNIQLLTCSQLLPTLVTFIVFQMVTWFNGKSFVLVTNGEIVKLWYGDIVIWYNDSNMSIWFGGSKCRSLRNILWDILQDLFTGHFVAQENSWDGNCTRRYSRIRWYLCTYDDTYLRRWREEVKGYMYWSKEVGGKGIKGNWSGLWDV